MTASATKQQFWTVIEAEGTADRWFSDWYETADQHTAEVMRLFPEAEISEAMRKPHDWAEMPIVKVTVVRLRAR